MCEFCLKHGEGGKWYLQAKNYSEDILSGLRRLKFLEKFSDHEALERELTRMTKGIDRLKKSCALH